MKEQELFGDANLNSGAKLRSRRKPNKVRTARARRSAPGTEAQTARDLSSICLADCSIPE